MQENKALYFYKIIKRITPFLVFFILILLSCKKQEKIDDTQIFRINRYDNISSLDPAFARNQANNWACNLMYNGLVKINDSLQIVPDVAKKWEISNNGKTYTFTLRDDVYFHKSKYFGVDSTRTVKATDFVYSFNRLTDEKVGGAGSWVMNNVENYHAINDSVLEVNIKKAFPPFLGLLAMKYCSVVPKEAFKDGQESFQKNPIGTGPFQFKLWEDNVKLILRKNPKYYEVDEKGNKLPYLEAVSISFLPEKYSEFLQLIQGNVDVMADLDPSYKNEVLTPIGELNPKYSQTMDMYKYPYLSTIYLCFYLDGEEVLDPKLRKAINLGIDKQKMITYLMNGIGSPAIGGFLPKGLPGYNSNLGEKHNPTRARELVNKYKKEKGEIPNIQLTTTLDYADVCEYVQAQLTKIGINIAVNIVPGPTLRDGKATGKFPFFRANWGADYPDAENFLSLFYSKNFAPEGPNYSHYKNEVFDKLYLESFSITDDEKRTAQYKKLDSLMMETLPVIPLYYDETTIFIQKNVKGFSMSPVKLLDLTRVYKTKK